MITYCAASKLSAVAGLCAVSFILTGCHQMKQQNPAQTSTLHATAPGQTAPAPVAAPPVPYVLKAQTSGAFIDFSIYNLGETPLEVKPENFAVISSDTRQVTPYNPQTTVMDLPQPAIVQPNSTLHGRAVFRTVTAPVGKRLVFKPDAVGTFADINRP